MADSKMEWRSAKSIYDFTVKDLDGNDVKLDKYRGKVLLVVNVAAKCGFTKVNVAELNKLYEQYHDKGLEILGFPCNQFGHIESACSKSVKEFIEKNKVKFDVFERVDVNGDNASPLFCWLKNRVKGTIFDLVKWNFTKFLVNKEGIPVERYAPNTRPLEIRGRLEAELKH